MRLFSALSVGAFVFVPATVFAGGGYPGAGSFTTVEGWITGNIAQFFGICLLAGLCFLIWLAHEYGGVFSHMFRGILALSVIVFAVSIFTAAFGGGATIAPETGAWRNGNAVVCKTTMSGFDSRSALH